MGRYAQLVSAALAEVAPHQVIVYSVRLGLPRGLAEKVPERFRAALHHCWVMLAALARRSQVTADVVHLVDGSHGYLLWLLPRPSVVTVHDVIPLLQMRGILGGPSPSLLGRRVVSMASRGLARADWMIVDSQNTARDVAEQVGLAGERVQVVPLAPVSAFTDGPPWSPAPPGRTPFVLHVGSDTFYKNRGTVIDVFGRLKASRSIRLVMVGPGPSPAIAERVERQGLSADVEWLRDIDDQALAELYQNAALLLFPSLYEGFGWPVLEAMSVGCPVVCSDILSDLTGDGALVAPALDDGALATACATILDDAAFGRDLSARARKRAASFSRARLGRALVACYQAASRGMRGDAHPR